MNLADLHTLIQITMGWQNCHMHQFIHEGVFYGELNDDFDDFGMEVKDEFKFRLKQVLKNEKDWLRYEYDFGDGWTHK
ncbi:MAG: plasmid pRiA4b ORF-3 family protein, partial [Methylococcaceae bacterium]|nr:plasmid pRiA4b ORF-3 family protein [Methylococcaceae bacterium]